MAIETVQAYLKVTKLVSKGHLSAFQFEHARIGIKTVINVALYGPLLDWLAPFPLPRATLIGH